MGSSYTQTITDFNEVLLSMAQNLAEVCPNSIIGANIRDIEKSLKLRCNFTKFIDLFCIKVLPYKAQIDSGDETYFLNKNYEDDVGQADSSSLNGILSLKSVWRDLKPENKEIVMSSMQILCALALDYYAYVAASKKTK